MRPPHVFAVPRVSGAIAGADRRFSGTLVAGILVAGALVAGMLVASPPGSAAAPITASTAAPSTAKPQIVRLTASGSMKLSWRGNGHGHGMSQYGAQGAAMKKLTTTQILAFYYPGTKLTTLKTSVIRVKLSNATSATTVFAGTSGLKLSGYGALPKTGYTQFRLIPSGTGLTLQGRKLAKWVSLKTHLAARAEFSSSVRWVRVLMADGTSTRYHGNVGAVRSGASVLTINRVSLDNYTQGVAPREMPASWQIAAVRAQAIAARSYAKSEMNTAGTRPYDICDTTSCQVYGGMAHYGKTGNLLYTDDPDAIVGNQNKVLTYRGSAIFAQYSASNGGATVDGGQPYLVGKTDPYDTPASLDPYLAASKTVKDSALAKSYGLKSITSIQITKRDGHGPWGGRIVTAYVNGTKLTGGAAHLATSGFTLGAAAGVSTDYLQLVATATAPSARLFTVQLSTVQTSPLDTAATLSADGLRAIMAGRARCC